MSTDPKGDPIRTWTIYNQYSAQYLTMVPRYFRLVNEDIEPPYYQGISDFQQSAYDNQYNDPLPPAAHFTLGYSCGIDQSGDGFRDVPADKCGVAMQQVQETGDPDTSPPTYGISTQLFIYHDLIYSGGHWIENPSATKPYTYYVFLIFNHPLFFRRTFELAYEYEDNSGNKHTGNHTYTPTDNNYGTIPFPGTLYQGYFQPSNAVWTFSLPNATDVLGPIYVKSVESND